jgi:hypothetical protein
VQVLMVHGLARTPLSLVWLARGLKRAGYRPVHFGYLALAESHGRIRERLRSRLSSLAAGGRYAIVAHSLGGLLVRAALAEGTVPPPEHALGFIEARWETADSGRRRKYYRLTSRGRTQLAEERKQWQAVDATLRGIWKMLAPRVPANQPMRVVPLPQGA